MMGQLNLVISFLFISKKKKGERGGGRILIKIDMHLVEI